MVPCYSIITALYTLESLNVLMEISATRPSILLFQITNKDSTMHILILLGPGLSRDSSLSSCQRFGYFPAYLQAVEQSVCAEHASFRDQGIQMHLSLAT